ncbi:hypothetical protein HYU14_04285 [Candidatus Woesearchaeota archaeon]|nr:hypothetical protein [Candidatus Woesearchaeota archaeon]
MAIAATLPGGINSLKDEASSQYSPRQNKPLDSAAGLLLMFSGVYRDASTFREYAKRRAARLGYEEKEIKEPSAYISDERAMLARAAKILASEHFQSSDKSIGFLEETLKKVDAVEKSYAAKAGKENYLYDNADLKPQNFAYVKSLMKRKIESLQKVREQHTPADNSRAYASGSSSGSPQFLPSGSPQFLPSGSPQASPQSSPSHGYRTIPSTGSLESFIDDLRDGQRRKELALGMKTFGTDGASGDNGLSYLLRSKILRDYIAQIERNSGNAMGSPFVDELRTLEALLRLKTESIGNFKSRRIDFPQFLQAYLGRYAPDEHGRITLSIQGQEELLTLGSLHRLGYGDVAGAIQESTYRKNTLAESPDRASRKSSWAGGALNWVMSSAPQANFRPASARVSGNGSVQISTSPNSALNRLWSWLTH